MRGPGTAGSPAGEQIDKRQKADRADDDKSNSGAKGLARQSQLGSFVRRPIPAIALSG